MKIRDQWKSLATLASMLGGLCLPVQANTTAAATAEAMPAPAVPSAVDLSTTERSVVRVALLLPLQSETLHAAAEAVRAGFQAAQEREPEGITVSIIETGDAAQDLLAQYRSASMQNDIVVGPLSRTDVTAVADSGAVERPTIALTPPDRPAAADAAPRQLPRQMLVIGLSVEEEARQLADWAGRDHPAAKAIVLFTKSAWQRRAARAFEMQWQQQGREAELIELNANDGFLSGRMLFQLKKQLESENAGVPPVLFLALDARQARQVRAVMGNDAGVYYGTSQINPHLLADRHIERSADEQVIDMDGTRLLDIPWQLQADHPAVMAYPRPAVDADQARSADMERLYALGIDAYRIAREIAFQRSNFELDGVTGKLKVRFDNGHAYFERTAQQAVYRDGGVVPAGGAAGASR